MRRGLSLAFIVACLLIAGGCGSSSPKIDIVEPVGLSLQASALTVEAGSTVTFFASLSNTANQSVIWHVNGTPGGGADCGLIKDGLYTAPSNVTAAMQVTITAVAQVNPTIKASATLTVKPALTLTIEPANRTMEAGSTQKFTLKLSDGTTPTVYWMAYGAEITQEGVINAPLAMGKIFLQVNSNTTPSKTAHAAVRVVASKAMVNGTYTFAYDGLKNGEHVAMAGTFNADGKGGLTGGVLDAVSPSGVERDINFTGTYDVRPDGRGVMTLNLPSGERRWHFAIAAPSEIPFAELSSASSGSGVMQLPGASTAVAGGVHLFGSLPDSKGAAIAGMFETDPAGFSGEYDLRRLGRQAVHTSLTGSGNVLGESRSTISVADALGTHEFRVYPTSPASRYAISLDPGLDVVLKIEQQMKTPLATGDFFTNYMMIGTGSGTGAAIAFGVWDLSLREGKIQSGILDEHRSQQFQTLTITAGTYAAGPGRTALKIETSAGTRSFIAYVANTSGTAVLDEDDTQVAARIDVQPMIPIITMQPTCYDATMFSAASAGGEQNLLIGVVVPDGETPNRNTLDALQGGTTLLDQVVGASIPSPLLTENSRLSLTITGALPRTYNLVACRAVSTNPLVPEIGRLWGVPLLYYPINFGGLPGMGPIWSW